jgi:hypothetical protein
MRRGSGRHDDLLAWPSPGGLLPTGPMPGSQRGLHALRTVVPEPTLQTWFAGGHVRASGSIGRRARGLSRAPAHPSLLMAPQRRVCIERAFHGTA